MLILEDSEKFDRLFCAAKNGTLDSNLVIVPRGAISSRRRYWIYYIRNLINGKLYIGRTYMTLIKRWWKHTSNSRTKQSFSLVDMAIAKYGEGNLEMRVICECENFKEMKAIETFYIHMYGTLARSNGKGGYNLITDDPVDGGELIMTLETREKKALANHLKEVRRWQNEKNTKYFGVRHDKGDSWQTNFKYLGISMRRNFPTPEEAAEFIDTLIYDRYGSDGYLNFPEKWIDYKIRGMDKEYMEKLKSQPIFSSKYRGVSDTGKGTWTTHIRFRKEGYGFGNYKTAEEAAFIVDKMFYYFYKTVDKLNFPERLNEYINDNLEELFNKLTTRITQITKVDSQYRGVYRKKNNKLDSSKKWAVKISHNKKYISGYFHNEIDAARFYDQKAIELFGDKAKTNFPKSDYLKSDGLQA